MYTIQQGNLCKLFSLHWVCQLTDELQFAIHDPCTLMGHMYMHVVMFCLLDLVL